jgi:ABC-type branched-subunit amino acid transport system ATPase component
VRAGYGRIPILHGVSLAVWPHELVSIVGPNGAGKSTAFKVIVGLLRPEHGQSRFDGRSIAALRPDEILRLGLAYVPQGRIAFPRMTALENLEMGAYLERDRGRIAEALGRHQRRRQRAGTLSGGEQQTRAIGRALMTRPRLVLLDEPSLGLSPKFLGIIFDKIAGLKASGTTMKIVEQNAAKALAVADRGYVLELGRNRFEGPRPALLIDPDVKRLYLGG